MPKNEKRFLQNLGKDSLIARSDDMVVEFVLEPTITFQNRKLLLRKRQMSSEKRMKRATSLNERMIEEEKDNDRCSTSGEQLFEWVIAPVATQRFFAYVCCLMGLRNLYSKAQK